MAVLTATLASCLGDSDNEKQPNIELETVTFEKATLPTDGANPGVMIGQTYESENGYVFQNDYNTDYGYPVNSGYTVSNQNDIKTAGYLNQYSVYSASSVKNNQFLIYNPPYGSNAYIQRKDGQPFYPYSVYIAPTTYTMLSVLNGDDYAKKFDEKDSLSIYIKGCDANGEPIKNSEISFNLIKGCGLMQYNSLSNTYGLMKFVNVEGTNNLWTPLPLYLLGKVYKILITFDGSDKSEYGLNTPQYLALDNFCTIAPESIADWEKQNVRK